MSTKSKEWIYKPLRIAAKQSRFSNEDIFDVFNRFPLDFNCNVEQLNHIFKATDPIDPDAFTGEFIEELHGEMLDKYLENAHKHGIKEICYICVHQIFEKDKSAHPDWLQVDKNGEPYVAYGTDYIGCPNSSWGEYTLTRIADLCKHDIDGVFLDGPLFATDCCYCDSCRADFKKRYGKEMIDATHREYTEYRVDALTRFVADIRRIIDDINPNIVLYLNNSALRWDVTGSNTRKLYPYVDIIGAEGGFFRGANSDTLYMCSAFAKDIEDKSEGKPTVIFTKAERTNSPFVTHTACETNRVLAQTVANGANIWYGIHSVIDSVKNEGAIAVKEFFAFLKDNEEYYTQTSNVAKVAIMWSTPTANYYSSSVDESDFTGSGSAVTDMRKADHHAEYMGFVELLEHNHILFDSIDDISIDRKINQYDLIVLPSCAAMSDANKKSILDYVKNGGTVVASFHNGLYDEYCEKIDTEFMSQLFGINYKDDVSQEGEINYMEIDRNRFPDIESPCQIPDLKMDLTLGSAEAICYFYSENKGNYKELKGLENPAITVNKMGRGHAILFAGTFGQNYLNSKNKKVCQLFGCITSEYTTPLIKTNAPKCVEITLRRQGDRYILHVINHALDGCRPVDRNIPLYNLTFDVMVGKPLTAAKALKGEKVTLHPTEIGARILLEELNSYSVIVLG